MSTPVSPKVTAAAAGAGVSGALGVLVLFVLDQAGVQLDAVTSVAVMTLVGAAVTFAAGYLQRDPLRGGEHRAT